MLKWRNIDYTIKYSAVIIGVILRQTACFFVLILSLKRGGGREGIMIRHHYKAIKLMLKIIDVTVQGSIIQGGWE